MADVSHELRTPLTALTTAADVLEAHQEGLDDTGRRAARLLVVESRRLGGLVADLMEISRLDAGVAPMAWEDVDVAELVRGALGSRGWLSRVEARLEPGVVISADPRRLDAVIGNLVGNAFEHGRPPVRVALTADDGDRPPGGVRRGRGHRPRVTWRRCSSASPRPTRPDPGARAAAWAWPSPGRTPASTGATSPWPTVRGRERCSPWSCPGSRRGPGRCLLPTCYPPATRR